MLAKGNYRVGGGEKLERSIVLKNHEGDAIVHIDHWQFITGLEDSMKRQMQACGSYSNKYQYGIGESSPYFSSWIVPECPNKAKRRNAYKAAPSIMNFHHIAKVEVVCFAEINATGVWLPVVTCHGC